MITRSFVFENYRTLGVDGEDYHELCLNQSDLEDLENFGDILCLTGLNNSGKSNIIDGIKAFANNKFFESDSPNFIDNISKPSIYLKIYDNSSREEYKYYSDTNIPYYSFKNPQELENTVKKDIEWLKSKKENLNFFSEYKNNKLISEDLRLFIEKNLYYFKNLNSINKKEYAENLKKNFSKYFPDVFEKVYNVSSENFTKKELESLSNTFTHPDKVVLDRFKESLLMKFDEKFNEKFDLLELNYKKFLEEKNLELVNAKCSHYIFKKPKIIDLDDFEDFKTEDLEVKNIKIDTIEESINNKFFFTKIFRLSNKSTKILKNAYLKEKKIHGAIESLANDINKELKKISEKFNQLYFDDYESRIGYNLKIKLEESRIFFFIEEDEIPLRLEEQSSGFRWFFNFFFNVLSNKKLEKGTILVMDEPGNSLHPKSQKELRKFMKKFAIKNNVTIIFSTHSGNMLDITNMDEMRFIKKKQQKTKIFNKFTCDGDEKISGDTTKQMEEAISSNKFYFSKSPYSVTLFVEGITDYSYINMFKNDLNIFPINGASHKVNKLIELFKKTPNAKILLDSDSAGNSLCEKLSKNKDLKNKIISLENMNSNFKTIEDLFCEEDKKKIKIKNKKYYRAVNLKNLVLSEELTLSDETKKNFQILIKTINSSVKNNS